MQHSAHYVLTNNYCIVTISSFIKNEPRLGWAPMAMVVICRLDYCCTWHNKQLHKSDVFMEYGSIIKNWMKIFPRDLTYIPLLRLFSHGVSWPKFPPHSNESQVRSDIEMFIVSMEQRNPARKSSLVYS